MSAVGKEVKQTIEGIGKLLDDLKYKGLSSTESDINLDNYKVVLEKLQAQVESLDKLASGKSSIEGLSREEVDSIVKAVVAYNGRTDWDKDYLKYANMMGVKVFREDNTITLKSGGVEK